MCHARAPKALKCFQVFLHVLYFYYSNYYSYPLIEGSITTMETYRRTVYGAALQTAQVLGLPYTVPANTTLNEKLSIQSTATLATNEVPRMRYLSLGIGGHRGAVGADGIQLVESIQHSATDAASYRMFPFVMRPLDADLTNTERERYGLRRVENKNGIDYAVYYLRRIDMTNVVIAMKKKKILNGVETISDFVPNTTNLSPVAPIINPGSVTTVNGEYVYATAKVTIVFDTFDATEILNAASVLFGDENYAFISEFGFVTGVDRSVQAQGAGGSTFAMNEIIAAQVFCHVSAMQPMVNQRNGFEATYDVGIAEPLMVLATP